MKKILLCIIGLFLAVAVVFAAFATGGKTDKKEVFFSEGIGSFSEFWVDGNKVYMKCYLNIENTSDIARTVNITAKSSEDVKTGLLKDENLTAYDEDITSSDITVEPGVNVYTVVFVGDFGGTVRKFDRLLPGDVAINVVE